ncbi:hypothetical protein LEP1GSC173_4330 [Leptospira interrogans str. HAI1594]|uniref:hypothetical protein n=1 Tax=Leptospira interrogans TaxID=173 RepID=UPI00000E02C7|nr:hypothetical protein [Leptospira interrogans]APH40440.1 Uncharacterized protein A9P81_0494 [Leptospira interrogans serovar Copenhageni/Icterohaemorrhagiae]EKP77348.1 hypothetical protein LEP1GSC173_4330 [Leptospira interrogans str. HAI1594]OCC30621.1 Uncharacterized protein GNX_0782 [Leptospira interrogans serovar Canicola]KPA31664.1 Uncharacterized protein AMR50_3706 [Leptospira interrogans]SIQ05223.1 hypothetical protein SAMN05421689_10342 [Leptospira interrogans]
MEMAIEAVLLIGTREFFNNSFIKTTKQKNMIEQRFFLDFIDVSLSKMEII